MQTASNIATRFTKLNTFARIVADRRPQRALPNQRPRGILLAALLSERRPDNGEERREWLADLAAMSAARRDMAEAAAVLRGVLLVIFFRAVEWAGQFDLRHDRAMVFPVFFKLGNGLAGRSFLLGGGEIDGRSVIVPEVKPLAVERRGIMNVEEKVEQLRVRHLGRVELDLHDLGMTRGVRADLFVSRIRRNSARISNFS
jgi:hypothetical protein